VFVHIASLDNPDIDNAATVDALEQRGQPVFRMTSNGPEDLGRFMFLFEFATAVAGHVLEINPFDQPNVQEAKDATKAVLDSGEISAPYDEPSALAALIADGKPPTYFAIMGYLQPSAEFDEAIAALRAKIRAKTGSATTFGYGPRFLHSTGQLHKGGPPEGSFIQFVHDGDEDVSIPGEPFSFKTLKNAQAIGDLQALQQHGRPVVRLRLDGDPVAALTNLTNQLG
jgi:hypothetical protein